MGRIRATAKPRRRVSERHLEHTLMELDQHMAASVADTVSGYHTDYVAPLFPAVKKLVSRVARRFLRRQRALEERVDVLEFDANELYDAVALLVARVNRLERPWWRRG